MILCYNKIVNSTSLKEVEQESRPVEIMAKFIYTSRQIC